MCKFEDYEITRDGKVFNRLTGQRLWGSRGRDGYTVIGICKKTYQLHRLVAERYLENPENKPVVDHIDRNPRNNHLDNLRFATYEENNANKLNRHGMTPIESEKHLREMYESKGLTRYYEPPNSYLLIKQMEDYRREKN